MSLKLSKTELRILRVVCKGDISVGGLSGRLGAKESLVSRVVKGLQDKGLVLSEKRGTGKMIRLSPASHAQKFRQLSDSRQGSDLAGWLSGSAIDLLILACDGLPSGQLRKEAGVSRNTYYATLKKLFSAGAARAQSGVVSVSDPLVRDFASAYADNLQLIMQSGARGANTSIRVRKHVVLRTDAEQVPESFTETGVGALANLGLEGTLTGFRDYYFSLDGKKRVLVAEESFIHALLLASGPRPQDLPLLSVFFAKNRGRLNLRRLKELACEYSIEGLLDGLREKADFYEKMRGMG